MFTIHQEVCAKKILKYKMYCRLHKPGVVPHVFHQGKDLDIRRIMNENAWPVTWLGLLLVLRTFNYWSADVKKQLFSSYCGSLFTCHLWCKCTVRQYRQMHVVYHNVFRRLMGYHKFCSASGMFVENRFDNFDARIRQLIHGFYQRLMCSANSLVNCVMNSSGWLSSDLYRNWNKCLYVAEMVL